MKRTDYIDREALKKRIRFLSTHYLNEWSTLGVLGAIDSIPAADVVEVKRGKWIDEYPNIPNDPRMICSLCGKEAMPLSTESYCPNCGADMMEEQT